MMSGARLTSAVRRLCLALAVLSAAAGGAGAGRARRAPQETPAQPVSAEAPEGGSLAVIVNRSNPVEALSFDELREYFLGERTHWPNGRRVQIVMLAPARAERAAILRAVYRMGERDFHAHFLRAKFIGEALEEPRVADTPARAVNFVFLQPGAIGYVRASEVGSSVKVVRVDGLGPGAADYKLKF